MMNKVSIVLVDWSGYGLIRKKKLDKNMVHCGLKPLLDRMNQKDPGMDFSVHLVINYSEDPKNTKWYNALSRLRKPKRNSKETYLSLKDNYPFINNIHFRGNKGMDIGAYNYGLNILRDTNYKGDVVFMNSSVMGPKRDNWLLEYQQLFRRVEDTGFCSITLNSHKTNSRNPVFMPHAQSFFLYTNTEVLSKVFGKELPGSSVQSNKDRLIEEGEIGMSQKMLEAGYSIRCSTFPDFNYRKGDDWTIPEGDIRYIREYYSYANQI